MSSEAEAIDISDFTEMSDLVEEILRTGEVRILKRGEQRLAMIMPLSVARETLSNQVSPKEARDTILDIIGIWSSSEPTDIAKHEKEYLAEAYMPTRQ